MVIYIFCLQNNHLSDKKQIGMIINHNLPGRHKAKHQNNKALFLWIEHTNTHKSLLHLSCKSRTNHRKNE